jgi:hypothetical protein
MIIIDQLIKVIINKYYLNTKFEIVPSLLEFKPTFNDKYNYFNFLLSSYWNINIKLWIHIITLFIGLIVMLLIYDYLQSISKKSKLLNLSFIFWLAGISCTFIGWVFWEKGVLDYIYLKPLFVFDLKDLYLDSFICLLLIYLHKHKKEWKSDSTHHMINHMKEHLTFLFRNKKNKP